MTFQISAKAGAVLIYRKSFDNGAAMLYYDQPVIFANPGETWQITIGVIDPDLPLKVTVAWADAPVRRARIQPWSITWTYSVLMAPTPTWGTSFPRAGHRPADPRYT